MKIQLFCTFLISFLTVNLYGQILERCATSHKLDSQLGGAQVQEAVGDRAVVVIPVVVHVIWNSSEENISDEQILTQIEVLNADFNAENPEIGSVPLIFQNAIADVDFRFCLATKDPAGNSTNGITRTQTNNNLGIGGTTSIHYSNQGGHDAWDTEKYLNIWVAKFAGNIGGVGSFPGEDPPAEQGVEINYKQFGTIGTAVSPPYNLGHTCTHEIGHYFNLEHVWGPNPNSCCNEDDGVDDTPDSCESYINQCPTGNNFSCTQPDMYMNFMNYTDDACMAMFSKGQKARMLSALSNFRGGLLDSDGCELVPTIDIEREEKIVVLQDGMGKIGFEIISPRPATWEVNVFNSLGQIFYQHTLIPNSRQAISGCPSGTYFIVAKSKYALLKERFLLTN